MKKEGTMSFSKDYSGEEVIITGGMGFIGSNLAHALVEQGAKVTIVDSMIPDYGGNEENISEIRQHLNVSFTDIRDVHALPYLVRGKTTMFNLAGQISHMDSMKDPITDLEINAKSQLFLLETIRKYNPGLIVVYASTRQIYGRSLSKEPVKEDHPLNPTDVNGINKLSGELYHKLYHEIHGIKSVMLRLTNTYGPRQLIKHNRQGFIAWFLNRALLGEEISLYGGGDQKRDFNFISDVVEGFLLAGKTPAAIGKVMNLGGQQSYSLFEVANLLKNLNPKMRIEKVPFPEERKRIDIGSFQADWSLAREILGWHPKVSLERGLAITFDYYRDRLPKYL